MEIDIELQVRNRIKAILFDQTITHYREHEIFYSQSNQACHFLIWKVQPTDWDEFEAEVQKLIEQQGYQFIPGACDVSTYNRDEKTGYKVLAFYKQIIA